MNKNEVTKYNTMKITVKNKKIGLYEIVDPETIEYNTTTKKLRVTKGGEEAIFENVTPKLHYRNEVFYGN